jgi:hypothetical protein
MNKVPDTFERPFARHRDRVIPLRKLIQGREVVTGENRLSTLIVKWPQAYFTAHVGPLQGKGARVGEMQ